MSWHEFLLLFFLDRCIRCRSELSDNWCGRNTPMRVRERSRRRLGLPPSLRIPPPSRTFGFEGPRCTRFVVAVVPRLSPPAYSLRHHAMFHGAPTILHGHLRSMLGRPIFLLEGNPPPLPSFRHHEIFHWAITFWIRCSTGFQTGLVGHPSHRLHGFA